MKTTLPAFPSPLADPLVADAAVAAILNEDARLQRLLDVEAALARAELAAAIVPADAAAAIAAACRADLYDKAALGLAAAEAGNLAIPLVKALTALVAGEGKRWVHWGATSQDIIDTATVLQVRDALVLFDTRLASLADGLAGLADRHRATPMAGRTWLQHALPITFGLKAAGWLDAVTRHRRRLAEIAPRVLVVQFGGAAGTLASLGDKGPAVARELAARLGLAVPDMPWHTARDRVAEVATFCGLVAGTLGKIARDVSLLMQTELAEASEPAAAGRGGSSTMPHKRNPVACAAILAAATAMPGLVATMLAAQVQEHERAAGPWSAEWRVLPEILLLTGGALLRTANLVAGLEIDAGRMRTNLEATQGLVMAEAATMALGKAIGRPQAHHIVETASRRSIAEGRRLEDVLAGDDQVTAHVDAGGLARLFEPQTYLGATQDFIDRVLAAHRAGMAGMSVRIGADGTIRPQDARETTDAHDRHRR